MKKYWLLFSPINSGKLDRFETYEEAVREAKRRTKETPIDILELRSQTVVPVPNIEIQEIE